MSALYSEFMGPAFWVIEGAVNTSFLAQGMLKKLEELAPSS